MTVHSESVPPRPTPLAEWRAGLASDGVDLAAMDRDARSEAEAWMARTDGSARVGDVHHTVPRFYLAGFADADGRVMARNRVGDSRAWLAQAKRLGARDFYTSVEVDGRRSAPMEDILGEVESLAAPSVDALRTDDRPLVAGERQAVAVMLSLQTIRGPRHRREVELQAEYLHRLSRYADPRYVPPLRGGSRGNGAAARREADRRRTSALRVAGERVVVDPNWHLGLMTTAEQIHPALADRPFTVVRLAVPLLVTGDEPVVFVGNEDDGGTHGPDCALTAAQRRRRHRDAARRGAQVSETIHFRKVGHVGVAVAEEVWFPLSPDRLLLLGPRGAGAAHRLDLDAEDSAAVAREVNAAVTQRSHVWVVARPDHPTFETHPMPPAAPLMVVCDGGTPMSRDLEHPPAPHMPHRRRAQDVLARAAEPG